jgi:preprotein translocase subunit SecB
MADKQPVFEIHRVYTKDTSFESPKSPEIFKGENKYAVEVAIDTKAKICEADVHEVTLMVRVTAKIQGSDDIAYLGEVTEAGLFTVRDFDDQQKGHVLNSACLNILFPYARETVSSMVNKGGFPALYLSPINFDALYAQKAAQDKAAQEKITATEDEGEVKH